MIKHFSSFITESPDETHGPVSVAVYLPKTADISFQPRIPDIVAAVRSGVLKVRRLRVTLKTLTPTQHNVSRPKILTMVTEPPSSVPLVLLDRGGRSVLLDGHHRVCASIEAGDAKIEVNTITASQLDTWQYSQDDEGDY